MSRQRRALLACAVGLAFAGPVVSRAQQPARVHRIGILAARPRPGPNSDDIYSELLRALRERGYVEGKNVAIEWRSTDGKYERYPALAVELANLKPDVIVSPSTPATLAVQKATRTIPVVAISVADPVASGFASSLARPGGNITGLSNVTADISPKLVELVKAVKPALSRAAVLTNPENPTHPLFLKNIQSSAQRLGIAITRIEARNAEDIERGFPQMSQRRVEALVVAADSFFVGQRSLISKLAISHRLPSVFPFREDALAGGLMSYGPNLGHLFRRAASFVDRILKGAKPSELPFEQPTEFELIINRGTAQALGLKLPQSLLARADLIVD